MKRIACILFALGLVLSLHVVAETPVLASGTVINVPAEYLTIQEAIDAANEGDTIKVGAGEYASFIVHEKKNIRIVATQQATVTSGNVTSINRGPIGDAWSMAAVKDSENIQISGIHFDGSAIMGQQAVVGIAYIESTGSIINLSVENITGTEVGAGIAVIGVHGTEPAIPTVDIKGCTISDNTVGVFVHDGSMVEMRFNRVVGNNLFGVLNDGGQSVDARYNWWGGPGGPLHSTNPGGVGNNAVSDGVAFEPWTFSEVVTQVVSSDCVDCVVNALEQAQTTVRVKFKDTPATQGYTATTSGVDDVKTTSVTILKYPENPAGPGPTNFIALNRYIDVYIPDPEDLEEIEIRFFYTDNDVGNIHQALRQRLQLLWWDGTQWKECSQSGVSTTATGDYAGYMWVKLTDNTIPPLAYLMGGEFGGYGGPTEVGICAIATAAYGTDTAQELDILREFRDNVLMTNRPGAGFVSFYYRASPPVAHFISRHEGLRTAARLCLVDPIVNILNRTHDSWSRSDW